MSKGMSPNEAPDLFALLDDVWALKGSVVLTAGQKALWFKTLRDFPLPEVRYGLEAHLRDPKRGHFLPMPADVIGQIQGVVAALDGRPGTEEAWATVIRASDDRVTIVWTAEMAEAYGVARSLLDRGDEIAARMAFKETYGRLVEVARAERRLVKWTATLGSDVEQRNSVLLPHVQAGRVPDHLLIEAPGATIDKLLALPPPDDATDSTLEARNRAIASMKELRRRLTQQREEAVRAQRAEQDDFNREFAARPQINLPPRKP